MCNDTKTYLFFLKELSSDNDDIDSRISVVAKAVANCKCYLLLEDPASEFCLSYKVSDRASFDETIREHSNGAGRENAPSMASYLVGSEDVRDEKDCCYQEELRIEISVEPEERCVGYQAAIGFNPGDKTPPYLSPVEVKDLEDNKVKDE